MGLEIETSEQDGMCRIAVVGEVDLYTSPELRAMILESVPAGEGLLEVDLSGVGYMDSSGVATLIEGLKMAEHTGATFVLVAPSDSVMKVLQLARLDSVFEIRPDL